MEEVRNLLGNFRSYTKSDDSYKGISLTQFKHELEQIIFQEGSDEPRYILIREDFVKETEYETAKRNFLQREALEKAFENSFFKIDTKYIKSLTGNDELYWNGDHFVTTKVEQSSEAKHSGAFASEDPVTGSFASEENNLIESLVKSRL